jgi:DNA mismatch repair protein MutL
MMKTDPMTSPVRILPADVANKIAAGEVVERPASVVKELVENSLDAGATRIVVRIVGAGRRLIEVVDNGHGMSEQDALLSVERHATSKVRIAEDLDSIQTLGFRGEALASIAAVSRFELVTRRADSESATQIKVDGGILRHTGETGAPVGTRISVNRLYFNTPVRAKFLKGITTELSHCIDVVQRHALSNPGVAFQCIHNEKIILDIPENASLRERVALIWGLRFVEDMVEINGQEDEYTFHGLIGTPKLSRSTRSHQFFFLNGRPINNPAIQFGFEEGYQTYLTIGRHPIGVVLVTTDPLLVDINIHPSKREVRFRDERGMRTAIRNAVKATVESAAESMKLEQPGPPQSAERTPNTPPPSVGFSTPPANEDTPSAVTNGNIQKEVVPPAIPQKTFEADTTVTFSKEPIWTPQEEPEENPEEQTVFEQFDEVEQIEPEAVYRAVEPGETMSLQLFDTYLLVPEDDRLLIIDQHALHERLNYDHLVSDLDDQRYAAQQLAVPILIDVPPASTKLVENNLDVFKKLGFELESFGGNTFQVTAICHLYEDSKVADAIYKILDELSQGNLFEREDFLTDFLRLATEACRASVKAGDRLTPEEKQGLVEGFRRLQPPYTCPHGRPIITELTLTQMEKSFRRRQ